MSIAFQNKLNELERRIAVLEAKETIAALPIVQPVNISEPPAIDKLWGEIKALKMRLGKKDSG